MLVDAAPSGELTPLRPGTRPLHPLFHRLVTARFWLTLLTAVSIVLPAGYVLDRAADASANVVYWDEFDTALALVLRLEQGVSPGAFLNELFAVNNEHRMLTSRLLFATGFALTGTVNFSFISLIGNASIVIFFLLMVTSAGCWLRRVRMAACLGLLLFQLEHYENFLWSGSSIDHFQVVLLVGASVIALAAGTRLGALTGGLLAMLATFTLAHGILVWFIGALMLGQARRWRTLAGWTALALATGLAFAAGFDFNRAHQFSGVSLEGALRIGTYWLALLGAVPALGLTALAPWLGALLLAACGWLFTQGAFRRERIAGPIVLFCVLALGLIAIGRAAETGGIIHSRYLVLGATAWALVAFMALQRYTHPRHPLVSLGWALPGLVAFNLAANHLFAESADSWIECRDTAAVKFSQHGVDGRGRFTLHPAPDHATALLREAEARGIYQLAPVCRPRSFPDARPSTRITYFVEEITVDPRAVYLGGWAAIPDRTSARGQIHLILQSETQRLVFSTVTHRRPDVAQALDAPGAEFSGFSFALQRDLLPAGVFQVGLLLADGSQAEFTLTAHQVDLNGAGKALLANAD